MLDITLDEFETCALDRLRVLTYVESLSHRGLPPAQFSSTLGAYLKLHGPLNSNTARTANLESERRRDEIGHWVLRLAFSRSPDLRARFVRAETTLFKHRYETDDASERAMFLRSLKLNSTEVKDDKQNGIYEKSELISSMGDWLPKGKHIESQTWYKVYWAVVPDLVAQRKVFVKGGYAYVPESMQISLVLQTFSERLERALEVSDIEERADVR